MGCVKQNTFCGISRSFQLRIQKQLHNFLVNTLMDNELREISGHSSTITWKYVIMKIMAYPIDISPVLLKKITF